MENLKIRVCPLFVETTELHPCNDELIKFLTVKRDNPIGPYGSSDKGFASGSPVSMYISNLKHAHLRYNLSIFYTIYGKPTELRLYGVFTHEEAGIEHTGNPKKQKNLAKRLSNQQFSK